MSPLYLKRHVNFHSPADRIYRLSNEFTTRKLQDNSLSVNWICSFISGQFSSQLVATYGLIIEDNKSYLRNNKCQDAGRASLGIIEKTGEHQEDVTLGQTRIMYVSKNCVFGHL